MAVRVFVRHLEVVFRLDSVTSSKNFERDAIFE